MDFFLYVDYDTLITWNVEIDWFINQSWTGLALPKPQIRLIAKAEDADEVKLYPHRQLFDAIYVIHKSAQDPTAYDEQGERKKWTCLGLDELMRPCGAGEHDEHHILVYVGPGEEDDPLWKRKLQRSGMRVGIITPRTEEEGKCSSMVGRIRDFYENPRGDGALTVYINIETLEHHKGMFDLSGFRDDVKEISPQAEVRLFADKSDMNHDMIRGYRSHSSKVKLDVCRRAPDEIMGRGGLGKHGDGDILVYVHPHEEDRYWNIWKRLRVCSIGVNKAVAGERRLILETIKDHYVAAGVPVHDTNSLKMHCSVPSAQRYYAKSLSSTRAP